MTAERHAEIARRAYTLWELEGRPTGRDLDHWLAAEVEFAASWHVEPQVEPVPEEAPAPRRPSAKRQRRKASASS